VSLAQHRQEGEYRGNFVYPVGQGRGDRSFEETKQLIFKKKSPGVPSRTGNRRNHKRCGKKRKKNKRSNGLIRTRSEKALKTPREDRENQTTEDRKEGDRAEGAAEVSGE